MAKPITNELKIINQLVVDQQLLTKDTNTNNDVEAERPRPHMPSGLVPP